MTTADTLLPQATPLRRGSALPRKLASLAVSVVLTFIGLTIVTFMIGRVIPIDPVVAIVGDRASPQVYDRVRRELGLDLPLYEQYGIYISKVSSRRRSSLPPPRP